MFGFFKKKKRVTAGSLELFRGYGHVALIQAKCEAGHYASFAIIPPDPSAFFDKESINHDLMSEFVQTIESRIDRNDFNGTITSPLPNDKLNKTTVSRYVVALGESKRDTKVLFHWPGPATVQNKPSDPADTCQSYNTHRSAPENTEHEIEQAPRINIVKEFTISFFNISIERDIGHNLFKLTATDSRTNQFAFSYVLERSPFATCLVWIDAQGNRYNMGTPPEETTLDSFEKTSVRFAINRIYDDQLIATEVLHAAGASAVAEKITKAGFQVLAVNKDELDGPQIVGMKDGRATSVIVRADLYPNKGTLSDMSATQLADIVRRYRDRDQDLYFAAVMLSNAEARNDYEKQALLRNGSFRLSVEEFSLLNEELAAEPGNDLTPPELEFVAGFGSLVAKDLLERAQLPQHIEKYAHVEYSLFGVYLALKVYLEFTEQEDEILWIVLGILTTSPYAAEEIPAESAEMDSFEEFVRSAISAYEYEAVRYLGVENFRRCDHADFGEAASKVMISRLQKYDGFSLSMIIEKSMQEAFALQPAVLWTAFVEMAERGALPRSGDP